ncbi:hypothetical protein GO308_10240 [Sphingomonas sp. SFZ2018-12]|uniref:hypothetical protein n=1 Tax=Sphingomonas sp. SFZ2018-12 TaxID=2683197 RepID=UPI001F0F54F0|nr:hypothetical protein [Sphingomonas sp. SFZ2018-12]MCH4893487.1 hypothetical protein [Sphingomonas sp. SFZ2018-12]
MRTRTLASLLILCGSTAALAQVSPPPGDPDAGNNTVITNDATESDHGMTPETTKPTDPTPADPTTGNPTPAEPSTDNTTDDAAPSPDPTR